MGQGFSQPLTHIKLALFNRGNNSHLNLRMSSELHSRVAAFVASTGTTINDFINKAIKDELKKVAAL